MKIKKPSFWLHSTEIFRAIVETIQGFIFLWRSSKQDIGQNKLIIVVPGLLSSDNWTFILRKYLIRKGFQVFGWELGTNYGRLSYLNSLIKQIELKSQEQNKKIILIGWSLGGVFCKIIAQLRPELIEKIITLGSPFANIHAPNHARWIFEILNPNRNTSESAKLEGLINAPTSMPSIAFYSKMDGIVPWQVCLHDQTNAMYQNIEVTSSHFGMGANPAVISKLMQVI